MAVNLSVGVGIGSNAGFIQLQELHMSVINTNISSLTAQRNLSSSQASLSTSMQRLSSGLRINSAKDDAAGLAISERMTSQVRGANQAARNANDGISLAQTAEGDMAQIGSNLQRMRELAVQSANATNSVSDRKALDGEVQALSAEIDRTAQNSSFNGTQLLDGSFTDKKFQVGANNLANDSITISQISSARTSALGGNAATVNGGVTTGPLVADKITLNGVSVGGSTATVPPVPGQTAGSAFAIAAAINAVSAKSSVTATAQPTSVTAAAVASAPATIASGTASINGIPLGEVINGVNATQQGANVAAAINLVSSQSGVTATSTAGIVKLNAADGRDIATLGLTTANSGLADSIQTGKIVLSTNDGSNITTGGLTPDLAVAGLPPANTTTSVLSNISSMNVLTADDARKALSVIDGALSTVNSSRASLGAFQNRFTSVVTSLQTTSENLSASRSRIQDADFAQETANLSRSQVLQQAGTAMVAQANQLPQGVLALLR
jgi:flagellin